MNEERRGDHVDRGEQRVCPSEGVHPEEAVVAFDRIARRALDLSGEEFLAALDEGTFDDVDPDAHPGLLDVLMALPLVR